MRRFGTILLLALLLPVLRAAAQDVTPATPQLLPFQQDASKPVSDEQLAIQLYQSKDYEKAAEIFGQLYDKKPSQYYYQYLFYSLVEIQEYGKATKLIKKCQKAEPEALRYTVDLGYVNYREGDAEKAKKLYDEALKKLGPNQQQIFDVANAFIIRGENDYAIETYRKGRDLLNNTYPFGFELASAYERKGDYRSAFEEYLNMLAFNRSYLNTVQDRIQMTLAMDVNNEKNEILRKTLLLRAQKDPDNTVFAELLWWYSIQQKDFDLALTQAKSLDRRMKENGDKVVSLASLADANGRYDIAEECYKYLVSRGPSSPYYTMARRELANTRYRRLVAGPMPERKELESLEQAFKEEISASGDDPEVVPVIRNLAHLDAFYLDKTDAAIDMLYGVLDMPGVLPAAKAECKVELADILLFTNEVWEATLLYQQVYQDFKYEPLGQEAKLKNAKLSFYIGEFAWAKAQADILKAATSKFISNDAIALSLLISENYDPDSTTIALGMYARADLLDFRNKEDLALKSLDSIPQAFGYHPILQHVLYKKAGIMRKTGHYHEADSLYRAVVKNYPDDILADEALMDAAALNENQLKDREAAKALYQELLDKYPGSIFIPEARQRFRALRGDQNL